ncbi:MAG: hypothetical protein IMY67_11160 [Bacteroidetes bacterium]|nr:hypothetical protein [Bacteroidota bacterium]
MKNLKSKLSYLLIILLTACLFTSCADVTPIQDCLTAKPCDFWYGLWHGMIAPFAWIGSLFNDDIAIYAVNNNGKWYNFGFVLGIGGLSSSSTSAARKR